MAQLSDDREARPGQHPAPGADAELVIVLLDGDQQPAGGQQAPGLLQEREGAGVPGVVPAGVADCVGVAVGAVPCYLVEHVVGDAAGHDQVGAAGLDAQIAGHIRGDRTDVAVARRQRGALGEHGHQVALVDGDDLGGGP
jgi:hypothetical protein